VILSLHRHLHTHSIEFLAGVIHGKRNETHRTQRKPVSFLAGQRCPLGKAGQYGQGIPGTGIPRGQ